MKCPRGDLRDIFDWKVAAFCGAWLMTVKRGGVLLASLALLHFSWYDWTEEEIALVERDRMKPHADAKNTTYGAFALSVVR